MKLKFTFLLFLFTSVLIGQVQITQCAPNISLPSNSNCEVILPDYTNMVLAEDIMMPGVSFPVIQNPAPGTLISELTTTITFTATNGGDSASCQMLFTMVVNPNICLTYVPDDAFEQALINLGYDSGPLDDYIFKSTAQSITVLPAGSGGLSGKGILDLTGIEDFTSLTQLSCNNNLLTTIDVSELTSLKRLELNGNQLTSLNINTNTQLEALLISDNQINNIDFSNNQLLKDLSASNNLFTNFNLSSNIALKILRISHNALSNLNINNNSNLIRLYCDYTTLGSLDLTNNTQLKSLECHNNQLTTLNLSYNLMLEDVKISHNQFTTIDLSNNTLLEEFYCEFNNISNIDLSLNTSLGYVYCNNNELTDLDVSSNLILEELIVNNNLLTSLNVKNGNNLSNLSYVSALNNPSLSCIQVDDKTSANSGIGVYSSWEKEVSTQYLESCFTYVPDDNFEQALIDLSYDVGPLNDYVPTVNINNINNLNLGYKGINDLTGIEAFIALESLQVNDNNLVTVDVSPLVNLITFRATRNNLTALDLSSQTNLEFVIVDSNNLSSLVINSTVLKTYQISGNNFTNLDFSPFPLLRQLYCSNNNLTSIDVSTNLNLKVIDCQRNNINSVNLTVNPAITELLVNNNDLESLNVKNGNNIVLTNFNASNNSNLTCVLVDDVAFSNANWVNKDIQTNFNETICEEVDVALKLYLQGAALNPNTGEETLMRDDLRVAGIIPTISPYTDALTCDASVFTTTGANAIVDWIWVELRDVTNNTIVTASQSALLQRDGDIVGVDGVSPLSFNQSPANYYVVINHRNHLGVMTANTFALSETPTNIDFTDANNQITFGTNAQASFGMPNGLVGMWAGNVNGDEVIQSSGSSSDVPFVLSEILNDVGNFLNFPTYTLQAYNKNDANMDGNVQYSGANPDTPVLLQNVLSHPNNFLNFSTYQIIEQLPQQ